MGFLDNVRKAAENAQQAVQQQVDKLQAGTQSAPPQPPPVGDSQTSATDQMSAPAAAGAPPPFPAPQQVPQSFHLERAVNAQVDTASATWRRWSGSPWAAQYPHLGSDRFQCVITIPPGTPGSSAFEIEMTLDPFRPNGGYRTPGFGNAIVLRELATGRTWHADRQKSLGPIVVKPDGVSGSFRRVYLRDPNNPVDRAGYVILEGDWSAAA
jgi:hypothetical protein